MVEAFGIKIGKVWSAANRVITEGKGSQSVAMERQLAGDEVLSLRLARFIIILKEGIKTVPICANMTFLLT